MRALLLHPLTRSLSVDDPTTTELRRTIIRTKPFLRRVYEEWAAQICAYLPDGDGRVLELGSGAGILADRIPGLVTSDVLHCSGLDLMADGRHLPFAANSLRSIVMIDVLHHIPDAARFLSEASRCIRQDGVVILVEPWVSPWSRIIYRNFHPEPFEPEAMEWGFPEQGPLSGANGALPWIIFERDRHIFEAHFDRLTIEVIRPMMPFRYILSGGVSMRSLMPGFSFPLWRSVECLLAPWMRTWAMFAFIVLRRTRPRMNEVT